MKKKDYGCTFTNDEFHVKYDGRTALLKVVADDMPENPRKWDEPIDQMVCWHRRYDLGDKHDYMEPSDFLQDMVKKYIPQESLVYRAKRGELDIRLAYCRRTKKWELYVPSYEQKLECDSSYSLSDIRSGYLSDAILENLSNHTMLQLLEQCKDFTFLPLYLYDHSGTAMSVSDFGDRWDSGQVGWICMDKENVMKNMTYFHRDLNKPGRKTKVTTKNWKEAAKSFMEADVNLYNSYLTGAVFGYELHELRDDGEAGTEIDRCYGFYGDRYTENGILAGFDVLKQVA